MERLTMWYDGNHAICQNEDCDRPDCPFADPVCKRVQDIIDRLAAYEETGLEPEEIISAAYTAKIAYVLHELKAYMARIVCALHELNAYKELGPIDRLRELAQADKEGRVKILPKAEKRTCGACENFNRTPGKRSGTCSAREWYADKYGSVDKKRGRFTPSQSRLACKQYIDREEAEAALRREQDDN